MVFLYPGKVYLFCWLSYADPIRWVLMRQLVLEETISHISTYLTYLRSTGMVIKGSFFSFLYVMEAMATVEFSGQTSLYQLRMACLLVEAPHYLLYDGHGKGKIHIVLVVHSVYQRFLHPLILLQPGMGSHLEEKSQPAWVLAALLLMIHIILSQ